MMTLLTQANWTCQDSAALYRINGWGDAYFQVNAAGHVAVSPQRDPSRHIDLYNLVKDLRARGLELPILVRFPDIVADRIARLCTSFNHAIEATGYPNVYRGVYPVKVNQQRHLIEEVVKHGKPFSFGLEAGSKPELLIAMANLDTPDALLICNGYKDRDFIETALMSQRLGHKTIIVLERLHELQIVLQASADLGIEPLLGVRAKLSTEGIGRWGTSAGDRAKFGLNATEVLEVIAALKAAGKLHCLQLLHYHIGSQISTVSIHGQATREAAQVFVELAEMGADMKYLDLGGGLGIDYDGSQSTAHTSQGYDLDDYAATVVQTVLTTCQTYNIKPPTLVTESGRAIISHQSVLIFDVMGINHVTMTPPPACTDADAAVIRDLHALYQAIPGQSLVADYRRAQDLKRQALHQFIDGSLDLAERAQVEQLFWNCCDRLRWAVRQYPVDHAAVVGLEELEQRLASIYYCNFSLFQSLPDSWAIDQVFPVMPIHRLDERPQYQGTLADLTCDSDGHMDVFIGDNGQTVPTLPLHDWSPEQPYLLGVFLGGAYQEILGDLHNLFGDTNAVHISQTETGYRVAQVIKGDSITEVLGYVQYNPEDLIEAVHHLTETALQQGRIDLDEARRLQDHFEASLRDYTYLR